MLLRFGHLLFAQIKRLPRALVGLLYTYGVAAGVAHLFAHEETLRIRELTLTNELPYAKALMVNVLSLQGIYPLITVAGLVYLYLLVKRENAQSHNIVRIKNHVATVRDVGLALVFSFACLAAFSVVRYDNPDFETYLLPGLGFLLIAVNMVAIGGSAQERPRDTWQSLAWLFGFLLVGQLLPNVITGKSGFFGAFYILVDAGIVYLFAAFGALITSSGRGSMIEERKGSAVSSVPIFALLSLTLWVAGLGVALALLGMGVAVFFLLSMVAWLIVGLGLVVQLVDDFGATFAYVLDSTQPWTRDSATWAELLSPFAFIAGYQEAIVLSAMQGDPAELITLGFMLFATAELIRSFDLLYRRKALTNQDAQD